ncbi:hypothetical protein SV7mr_19980 [Stieleria bergensis]|uniref:OmpR/PhoB-type domain-containing protein n=1 Tax=Stieleria bergensis TaxID=2528025 RepID=A0A517STN4_9BACT|nr:hypothetical protein SV7mr_19980 [Planctomycetes bacterium SV_7m_r]
MLAVFTNHLTYGANDIEVDVAGFTIKQIALAYAETLNLDPAAVAYVDVVRVDSKFVVEAGQRIEWMREYGRKGGDFWSDREFRERYSVDDDEFQWCLNSGLQPLRSPSGRLAIENAVAIEMGSRLMQLRVERGKNPRLKSKFVDEDSCAIVIGEKSVHVGNCKELKLFRRLSARPGQRISLDSLMEAGWGIDTPVKSALQQCIARLRRKLHVAGMTEFVIESEVGFYRLLVNEKNS